MTAPRPPADIALRPDSRTDSAAMPPWVVVAAAGTGWAGPSDGSLSREASGGSLLREALVAAGHPAVAPRWSTGVRPVEVVDLVLDDLARTVAELSRAHGTTAVRLLGVGEAGLLALCYAALWPAHVLGLALVATPVDFAARPDAPPRAVPDGSEPPGAERVPDWRRLVAGRLAEPRFRAEIPLGALARATLLPAEPGPASPGDGCAMARDWCDRFHVGNRLMAGGLRLSEPDGPAIDLARVAMPVLAILPGPEDPRAGACRALGLLVGSEQYREWSPAPGRSLGPDPGEQAAVADALLAWAHGAPAVADGYELEHAPGG